MRRIAPACAAVAALAWTAASGGTAASPACTADAALRPFVNSARSTLDDGPAVATHPVSVRLDFHAAADGSYPSVDSLKASAPAGVRISAGEDWSEWIVTAQDAGIVRLSLTWVQGSGSYQCSGAGEVSLHLKAPKPVRVTIYQRHMGKVEVAVKRGRSGNASPIRVIVRSAGPHTRCCRGTQSWPAVPRPPRRGKALLDRQVPMAHIANPNLTRRNKAVKAFLFRYADYGLTVEPCCAYGPRFKRTTLAYTVDLLQAGRRVAWMSTGLACLNRAFSGGGGLFCRWVGFRKGR